MPNGTTFNAQDLQDSHRNLVLKKSIWHNYACAYGAAVNASVKAEIKILMSICETPVVRLLNRIG